MTASTPTVTKLGPDPVILRELRVVRSALIAPRMMRVTFGGEQLEGFTSPAPDDHVVLFFLREGQQLPTSDDPDRRPIWDERPPTRDYTPRFLDASADELTIDFVLHGAGVASGWAEQASPGDRIAMAGPRASVVVENFEHYVLVGDEASLPAVSRRLEELPLLTTAQVIIEVQDESDELPLVSSATTAITWCHRGDAAAGTTTQLFDAVRQAVLPDASVYTCVAAETDIVRRLRQYLLGERGLNAAHTRFSGYWKLGRT